MQNRSTQLSNFNSKGFEMNIVLISTGIKAVLRAAQSGAVLYAEHSRDRAIFLPSVRLPDLTVRDQIDIFLRNNPNHQTLDEFSAIWGEFGVVDGADSDMYDAAFAKMQALKALQKLNANDLNDQHEASMIGAGAMVEQWRLSKRPPSAIARFALTVADIGLEFVSTNPSLFGVSGKGEALVVSFASHMESIIPNDVQDFGQKEGFTNRLLGGVLRATLSTFVDNPDLVIEDEHTKSLVTAFIAPVIEGMPEDLAEYLNYQDVVDAMTGPAVGAMLAVVAENPGQYFGDSVKNDKALSSLSKALITEAATISHGSTVLNVFGKEGMLSLYQAGMEVAINKPEVFIDNNQPNADVYKQLISGVAEQVRATPKLDRTVVSGIAAEVVKVVGNNAGTLFKLNGDDSWDKVALSIIKHVTDDLNTALTTPSGAQQLFTVDDFKTMALIVVEEINENPLMLGVESTELQAIVKNISEIMVDDQKLLLSRNDWMVVASLAASQAAKNPGKLFDTQSEILKNILSTMLTVASETWQQAADSNLPKLAFGETLLAMIEMVIKQLAGNIAGVKNNPEKVAEFLEKLLVFAQEKPDVVGSANLREVFGTFLAEVMKTGIIPTNDKIREAFGVAA